MLKRYLSLSDIAILNQYDEFDVDCNIVTFEDADDMSMFLSVIVEHKLVG